MSVQLGFILLYYLVTSNSTSMHGLPCSSLGHCFGNPSDVNTDPAPSQEPNTSRQSRNNHEFQPEVPVIFQPEPLPGIPQEQQRTVSSIPNHSTRNRKVNGTNSNSICGLQDKDDEPCSESPPPCHSFSQSSEDDELELERSPELQLKYPQIPRPSIIIRQPKVSRLLLINSVFDIHLKVDHFIWLFNILPMYTVSLQLGNLLIWLCIWCNALYIHKGVVEPKKSYSSNQACGFQLVGAGFLR